MKWQYVIIANKKKSETSVFVIVEIMGTTRGAQGLVVSWIDAEEEGWGETRKCLSTLILRKMCFALGQNASKTFLTLIRDILQKP